MWGWVTGSAPADDDEYADDAEGQRVEGVRLFNDQDFERFVELMDSSEAWTLSGGPDKSPSELEVDQVKVERRPCPLGKYFDVFRVSLVVDPAPFGGVDQAVAQISSVLLDSAYRKQWDARCACNGTLAKLGRSNYVGFYGGIAPTPISSRDFCTLKSWRYNYQQVPHQHVFVNHSIKWADFPPQDGFIRARSFQTGNILSRRPDGTLLIRYLSQSDIKGWIPQYIVNYVTSIGAPEMMRKIVQAALEYPAWLEKEGKEAAYSRLDPEKDTDEVVRYGDDHKY